MLALQQNAMEFPSASRSDGEDSSEEEEIGLGTDSEDDLSEPAMDGDGVTAGAATTDERIDEDAAARSREVCASTGRSAPVFKLFLHRCHGACVATAALSARDCRACPSAPGSVFDVLPG